MAISLRLSTCRGTIIATATRLPPPYQVRGRNDMRKTERPWVVGDDPVSSTGQALDGQPGGVGGEAARGEMVQPHAVLEVSDGVLDLGVAAMVGLKCQGFPLPVGDEGVIAVVGEERQLGTGRGLHPPDDEPHRCGVGLTLEGRVVSFSHVGGAVHPVGIGVQSASSMSSMMLRNRACWRTVME